MPHVLKARGVVYVHSAPAALCPHVEWAVTGVLGGEASVEWTPQPAQPASYRAELSWRASRAPAPGSPRPYAAGSHLRFEVTEEPSPGDEGERYSYTPALGIFHAVTGPHGDILVPEDRLRAALADERGGWRTRRRGAAAAARPAWDDELEPFRYAGDGAPVRWLHQVV